MRGTMIWDGDGDPDNGTAVVIGVDGDENTEFIFFDVENNRSEENRLELPEYIATTSLVLCSVVLGVGLLGNLLVILVILTNKVCKQCGL